MDKLEEVIYFPTILYVVKKPEFLQAVKEVSDRHLEMSRQCQDGSCDKNEKLVTMTGNYSNEESIASFTQYVSQTAWNILSAQGYAMNNLVTFFTEMWTQEHKKYSHMDQHLHGMGAQISAFYFLEMPKDGCKMVIHDPRHAKVIINLPQTDDTKVTQASTEVVFSPEPGTLVFTNSWLPHSFTKNMSDEPTRFVHMNLSIAVSNQPANEPVIL